METWNREELYAEIWEQPLVKVAAKYGISAVMLGKVCRKLQIPLPGRGYWTKKEFGKPVERLPLPEAKDLPVLTHHKEVSPNPPSQEQSPPVAEPTDDLYKSIIEMESRTIPVDAQGKRDKLVSVAAKTLSHGQPDSRGILARRWDQPQCLDIRVTKRSVDRALLIANVLVETLEREKMPVTVQDARSTTALIFGHAVSFAIIEKTRETGRREVKEYSWTRSVVDYAGTGVLEFRAGDYTYGGKVRDGKMAPLEDKISLCIGALMREARKRVIRAEEAKQAEIERRRKAEEMAVLSRQIAEEEKKVKEFEGWVDAWARARQMRDFITALERVWRDENHDLSPDTPKGNRIAWMKQQADRMDPMLPSPPSILDL